MKVEVVDTEHLDVPIVEWRWRNKMNEEKLKTLKDLSSVSINHIDHTKRKVIGIDDSENLIFDTQPERRTEKLKFVSHELLKEEAKKWIDVLTEEHHQLNDGYETTLERNFDSNRGCSVSDDGSICDICHTLRWIKMFFGLELETKNE